MLICDLCGGRNNVQILTLNFTIKPLKADKPSGTVYEKDVCDDCYGKLYNMINGYNNAPTLDGVLSKGLDLRQRIVRKPIVSNRGD